MKGLSFKREHSGLQGDIHRFVIRLFTSQKVSIITESNKDLYNIVETQSSTTDGLLGRLINFICINHYQKVFDIHEDKYNDSESYQIALHNNSSNTLVADNYNIKDVYQLLDTLSGDYRILYTMYISGYNCGQIAVKLSLPIETIEERIEYVQNKLHQN